MRQIVSTVAEVVGIVVAIAAASAIWGIGGLILGLSILLVVVGYQLGAGE